MQITKLTQKVTFM